jgi:hypothetical protein
MENCTPSGHEPRQLPAKTLHPAMYLGRRYFALTLAQFRKFANCQKVASTGPIGDGRMRGRMKKAAGVESGGRR